MCSWRRRRSGGGGGDVAVAMETAEASRMPGVVRVFTHETLPPLGAPRHGKAKRRNWVTV